MSIDCEEEVVKKTHVKKYRVGVGGKLSSPSPRKGDTNRNRKEKYGRRD